MVIYIEIILILLLSIILKNDKFKKYGIPIIFIFTLLIVGTRNELGLDDKNYIEIFNNVKIGNMNGTRNAEYSYILISQVVAKCGFNYKMLFLVYSIMTFGTMYICIKKLDINKIEFVIFMLSYLIFCFSAFLTTMRQALAASIVFLAFIMIKEKKYKRGILLTIIAGFFHNSAWMCLPILIIFSDRIKINNKIKMLIPILCLLISKTNIVYVVIKLVNQKLHLGYDTYILNVGENNFVNSGILVLLMFIIYEFQFFIKTSSKKDEFLYKGQLLYFSIFYITSGLGFIRRFSYYLLLFESFILVSLTRKIEKHYQKNTISIIIIVLLCALNIYLINSSDIFQNLKFENFSLNFRS